MFVHPLGLLALAAVPAVVGLHLFRRRFRRHPVSAIFLWEAADRASVAGRQREPLRTNPSFWCELLAAALLALAFAGLRLFGAGEATHLVVVLDGSASMAAGDARDEALELLEARVAALPRGSRVTVIESGHDPVQLAGPAAFPAEALAKAAEYAPRHPRHGLDAALTLAGELAGDGAVLLVTDRLPAESPSPDVEVVALGAPADNLAIVQASRRRERDDAGAARDRVQAVVANYGRATAEVELEIRAGDEVLARRPLSIAPGDRAALSMTVSPDVPTLTLRLPPDALALDDVAWLATEPPRVLALATTFDAAQARRLGIASGRGDSLVDRWLALVPDAIDARTPGAAHLVLGPTVAAGDAWCLALESRGEERRHLIGPFLMDRQHPLLEGVTLEGIVWAQSTPAADGEADLSAELARAGAPLVSAGDASLLVEERAGGRVLFRANLDPAESSLQRSPDWPILLANLAEVRRAELPGPRRTNVRVGEAFTYRDRGAARYALTGPAGDGSRRREVSSLGTLVVEDPGAPGEYVLARLEEDGGERELCRVALSFADAGESDLRELSRGELAAEADAATILAGYTFVEVALLALVLGALALDWWVLGRRPRRTREGAR